MTNKLLLAGKEITEFQSIKDVFDNEDVIVITATSMALAIFLTRKNMPDLIISQIDLIDGHGLTFYDEIKNEPELAKIPFALITTEEKEKKKIVDEIHLFFPDTEKKFEISISDLKNKILTLM